MPGCVRLVAVWLVLLAWSAGLVWAQRAENDERPALYVAKEPPSRQERDRRESLKRYTLGLLCEREDRLPEALQAFEEAARLDPEAPAVFKAQVPILLALDRSDDALAAMRKTLDLDPADCETWYLYARLLKAQDRVREARDALRRGVAVVSAKEAPDLAQQMSHDLGVLHESLEEYPQAIEALRQTIKILERPDVLLEQPPPARELLHLRSAETWERVGRIHVHLRQFDQAIAAYRQAQDRSPQVGLRLNYNLAQLCQQQGRQADALTYLDAYLRQQPQGVEAYELKIGLLHKLNRGGEVLPWLTKASQADALNVGLKLLLARQYAQARQAERAQQLYQELAEQSPSLELYRDLFKLYRQEQGVDRVLSLLDGAVARGKGQQPAAGQNLGLTQARAMIAAIREDAVLAKELLRAGLERRERQENLQFDTLHFLAVLADKHRQLGEAERYYRQCLGSPGPQTEALLYGGLLRILWKARKYEAIVSLCREGLKRSQATNHVLFHNDLAKALARLERPDEALAAADRAVNLAADTDRLVVRHLRVRVLAQAERFGQAIAECQDMLKEFHQPGDMLEIRYLLSTVYSAARNLPKAEQQLALILKADPNNATANNDLGYIWADQGKNLAEAEAMVRKAIEQDRRQRQTSPALAVDPDQDHAAYVDSLGWVLFRRGQVEEARKELERAAALPDGDDPVIWDHLGDVYFRLQLTARARTAWEKAAQLYDQERRRKLDDRYRDLQRKLQLVKSQGN